VAATRQLSWAPRYAALVKGRLEADIYPVIGDMDVAEITPRQILDAIRRIDARGSIEMAHRVKSGSWVARSAQAVSSSVAAMDPS
jgi:integrase